MIRKTQANSMQKNALDNWYKTVCATERQTHNKKSTSVLNPTHFYVQKLAF